MMEKGKVKAKKVTKINKRRIRGTFEWAKYNENCITGCSHGCWYCYARNRAVRMGARTPDTWKDETISRKAMQKIRRKRDGRIMFPTTHDITPHILAACAVYLERLLGAGNEVLIVSKPHFECIEFLCETLTQYKDQILFRFTIGSACDDTLKLWEPNAPDFEERIESLKLAYNMGYQTSVSCEPMLDREIHLVVDAARDYVTDAIWLGKANNLIGRMTNNGADKQMILKGAELVSWQCDEAIWELYKKYKDDLIIKWKESIKEVVGLALPTEKGLDE